LKKQDAILYLAFFIINYSSTKNKLKFQMGRGDKKTKKGKIFMGSFGKSRPATKNSKEKNSEKDKEKKEA
jgi:30S ribosomal protein S31